MELRKSYIVYIITYLLKRDRKHTHTHTNPNKQEYSWNVEALNEMLIGFFSVVILDVCPS